MTETPFAPIGPLVDAEWLKGHYAHPDLIVLDARIGPQVAESRGSPYTSGAAGFERDGHIPGARFVDLLTELSDPNARFPFTRPQNPALRAAVQRLGIRERSVVVVYDSLNSAWAARAWWVLRAYGHPSVYVLDGGMAAWKAIGGDLEYGGAVAPAPGDFAPEARDGYFVDTPDVLAALERRAEVRLICASRSNEFTGDGSSEPRRGHIPGSFSVPYRQLLDGQGRMQLDRVKCEALRLGLEPTVGFEPKVESILYCGGGVNAAGLALGLVTAGYSSLQVYDGSLNEWRDDPRLPLELGPDAAG